MVSDANGVILTSREISVGSSFGHAAVVRAATDPETRVVFSTEGVQNSPLFADDNDANSWSHLKTLHTARELQQKLLPNRCPRLLGYHLAARSTPALEVSGDHFNFLVTGGSQIGLMIADVSGKGLPAAKLVAALRATFRTQSWGNHDVRSVLTRVNSFLLHCLKPCDFITCTYGLLDPSRRRFSFARAGHEPLLLWRAGEVEVFAPNGFPLGVLPDLEFARDLEVLTLQLEDEDRILLFTDGLTEAMNPGGHEFGLERIRAEMQFDPAWNQIGGGYDDLDVAAAQINKLEGAVTRFVAGEPSHDDRTLMCLVVRKSNKSTPRLERSTRAKDW